MACIIKSPSPTSKGVVTFTTQERDKFILKDENLYAQIDKLKDKWIIGLHHNWHDYAFKYDSLFDFSMAGEEDLKEVNSSKFTLISQDACNFSPPSFSFNKQLKFWDVLYVARAVYFKNIPEFFKIIRTLFDQGNYIRVLLIAPIPKSNNKILKDKTTFYNIRDVYNEMFSTKEQDLFTLLTTDYRDPFPFDIQTVSHFYKSSRVFVHSANNERRCRVAGYAWASGMPVVSLKDPASLLSKECQKEPYLYLADSYEEFPQKILEAINFTKSDSYTKDSMMKAIIETSDTHSVHRLIKKLSSILNDKEQNILNHSNFNNLDLRLGRHFGLGNTTNSIGWSLKSFANYLQLHNTQEILSDLQENDPERSITKYKQYGVFSSKSYYSTSIYSSFVELIILRIKRLLYPIKKKFFS